METYVMDACAYIAYLRKENGHETITGILKEARDSKNKTLIHNATLAEVYYDFWRAEGKKTADEMLEDTAVLPFQFVENISNVMVRHIGHFKVNYKISFADSIVLATAKLNNAKVVTSDHHEFDAVEKSGDVQFEWIR